MIWLLRVAPLLGLIAMGMSLLHLLPIGASQLLGDGALPHFAVSMAINLAAGSATWLATRRFRGEIGIHEGVLLVVLVWTGGAFFAAIPLLLTVPGISFTDAFFEATSGLTATGATVLHGLDGLPPSVNLWRGLLQWLGGMGVIVLAIAVLPMLGVGGRQLFKAEIPGPMKADQLTPRITETAKGLWLIYAALTAACCLAYYAAGMSWVDAVMHSLTTLSLGGFSTHDASFGYFNSPVIESVAILFMLLAGVNFATHFVALRGLNPVAYLRDVEVRYFVIVVGFSVLAVASYLHLHGIFPDFTTSLRYAAFNATSVGTTTGYSTADYNLWPVFVPLWVLFLGTFLTCSGSTGGGVKMIRAVVLFRQVYREFKRLAHPNAIVPLKISGQPIPVQVIFAVLAFFFMWVATTVAMTLLLTISGLDAMTAFSAVVACLNNIGPGLQEVGPSANFSVLTNTQTWICTFAMFLGRLELFTLFLVFTPTFWRK